MRKNFGNIPKQLKFFNKSINLELYYLLWKNDGSMEKLWYCGKNYGTVGKTMVL